MDLTPSQKKILRAIASGDFLKAHRDIEGNKTYQLHALDGGITVVDGDDVQALVDLNLIDSNKKFPAATFWLTEKGKIEI